MDYTAQNLEYAVSVFYNGEQSERAKAHAWLTAAQRVPQAWNFVWELLQPNKVTEIQFYAATTLHTKILRCWNELPPESYEELKNKLLQAIFMYSKGPKIVTNRLCISLAAFILQQGTLDLATILRPLSTEENSALLLEVLTVIPEEYNSMTMGSALRSKNRISLQQVCPRVLDDMLWYLQTVYNDYSREPPSDAVVQSWVTAATCASSWLALGGEDAAEHAAGALPDRMPLCRALLAVVQVLYTCNPLVSDAALDACEACLAAVRAAGAACAAARYPASALQLMAHLAALATPIVERDNQPNSPNEELLCSLITCLVAVGECHAHAIVQAAENQDGSSDATGAKQLIQLLLLAQGAPGHYPIHETRSNFVFGFWYTLQDEILNIADSQREVHAVWKELFSSLLTILVTKSEAAEDVSMSKDELELLRCYRQDIADTVMYCYGVLGEWCWAPVEAMFGAASSERAREAALHVFAALADAAPHQRAPAALVALLHHALRTAHSSTDKRMLNTALDCLGSYASWLSSVGAGRELGRACVRAAGAALPRAAPAAALALRKLAADCAAPAAALAADIVHAAQSSAGGSDAWVRRQLVAAAGAALSAADESAALPLLRELARSLEADLTSHANEPRAAVSAAETCAALMSSLSGQASLGAELFRILAPALQPYATDPARVEALFHFLKPTLGTLMEGSLPFMNDISKLILTAFYCNPCTSGTDVLKLAVLMLGQEYEGMRHMFYGCVMICKHTLKSDPSARSDLTEGLFTMLHAITKKRPNYLDWLQNMLPDLVDLACGCVAMWEAGGSRAACAWLAGVAAHRPAALQPRAPALTAHALSCIGGLTPRNQIEPLADLLLSLNRAAWEGAELATWLRAALAGPAFPTVHATEHYKHKFIAAVIKEKSSKRRLLETVQEFSLVCRGLVDTEYARQTLASKQLVA